MNDTFRNWGEAPRYEDAVDGTQSRRVPDTDPELTPYLGPRSRLSQVWANRWTVLLLLILVRVILATGSLDNDLESARDKAFSACTGVESMGSAMASMPHYMARGLNELSAKSIESAVRALESTLLLMITAIQEIVVFIVNILTSTYVCLITLAVKGSVAVVVDALKEITDFINGAVKDISDSAGKEVQSFEDAINKVTQAAASIPGFLGKKLNLPTLDLPSLDKLKNGLTIPTDFETKLDNLEKSIPTFDEVKNAANDAIRIPFQLLIKQVNSSLGIYEFDRSVFPIPQKQKLTFCSNDVSINSFFDSLKEAVLKVRNILLGIIIALAILATIPMGWRELRAYRTSRRHAHMLTDPSRDFDPVDVIYIASRPHSSVLGLKLAKPFKSQRRQVLVRWAVAYVTSPPAIFVLSLGLAGLAGALCQFIVLKQVEIQAPKLAAEVGKFTAIVVDKLDATSKQWAAESNAAINTTNAELNKDLFGWVQEGTGSINDTLNVFVDKMHSGVDSFLGGTPLDSAVKDVLDCLITLKVRGVQKAMTWAYDNAHITFPRVPDDLFSIGALEGLASEDPSANILADPGSKATDKITAVVVKLIDMWEASIKQEAMISAGVVAAWLLLVLIALVRTAVLFFGRDLNRGEGGGVGRGVGVRPVAPSVTTTMAMNGGAERDAFGNFGGYGNSKPTPFATAVQPVFPSFGHSPESPSGPPSPEEYPNEKIQMGQVTTGQVTATGGGTMADGANRDSHYPRVDTKQYQ